MKQRSNAPKTTHTNGRNGETRRPIKRNFAIHQAIRRGRFPNCRTFAEAIGVNPKTIQRDVTFMQKNLGLPLVYDNPRHGYHDDQPVTHFPFLKISLEDIVALFPARKALEPLQGSALEADPARQFPALVLLALRRVIVPMVGSRRGLFVARLRRRARGSRPVRDDCPRHPRELRTPLRLP